MIFFSKDILLSLAETFHHSFRPVNIFYLPKDSIFSNFERKYGHIWDAIIFLKQWMTWCWKCRILWFSFPPLFNQVVTDYEINRFLRCRCYFLHVQDSYNSVEKIGLLWKTSPLGPVDSCPFPWTQSQRATVKHTYISFPGILPLHNITFCQFEKRLCSSFLSEDDKNTRNLCS